MSAHVVVEVPRRAEMEGDRQMEDRWRAIGESLRRGEKGMNEEERSLIALRSFLLRTPAYAESSHVPFEDIEILNSLHRTN